MPERTEVEFDSSTESAGPHFLGGEVVKNAGKVCLVEHVRRKQGTVMIATLAEVLNPTPEQEADAIAWERRSLGA